MLAVAFCLARIGNIFTDIADRPSLRSNLLGIGIAATGTVMILAPSADPIRVVARF